MAGDWIKVEKITADKQAIRSAARECRVSHGDAFLAWFRLWSHFDGVTDDGFVDGFTAFDADDIARIPGFGEAMERAKWLVFDQHGCTVINWGTHNGNSAKARVLKNRRQAKWRDVDAAPSTGPSTDVDAAPSQKRLPEKRREDTSYHKR